MKTTIDYILTITGFVLSILVAYATTKATIYREKTKGKYIILEMIKKYIICFDSCWDKELNILKKDEVTKNHYLRIMQDIEKDLIGLQNNVYFTHIIKKYPKLTYLQIHVSMEIAENLNSKDLDLKAGTLKYFCDTYDNIKKDFQKNIFRLRFRNDKALQEFDEMINYYKRAFKIYWA